MTTSGKRDGGVEDDAVFAAAVSTGNGGALADGEDRGARASGRTVVVIGGRESELVARAAKRGLEPLLAREEQVDEAVELALKQAAELNRLRAVAARLAQVERAKGILMERHKLSERDAHERMRRHARNLNVKLAVVAEAIEDSYLLVPGEEP